MYELYDYQKKIKYDAAISQKTFDRTIIQSPTGSGKTVTFADICSSLAKKNKKVLLLTDLTELKQSTKRTISKFLRKVSALSGDRLPYADVVIAMAQTVSRRLLKPDFRAWLLHFDYYIIDEAHMAHNNKLILDLIIPNHKKLLGFSATPVMPLGNTHLMGDLYQDIVHGPYTIELINKEKLAKPNYFISGLDSTDSLKIKHFDFDPIEVKEAFEKRVIYDSLLSNIVDHKRQNVQSLVFCNDIYHSYKTCDYLNKNDIKAMCLASSPSMPRPPKVINALSADAYQKKINEYNFVLDMQEKYSGDRTRIIADWENGKFSFLLNPKILMTGFDSPTIRDIHLFYSGLSFREFNQRVGRGARIVEGLKDEFNVFDYGQNVQNLTFWETMIDWQLYKKSDFDKGEGKEKKPKPCPWCNKPLFTDSCSCGFQVVKIESIREHANLKETNLQKSISYNDVKQDIETKTVSEILAENKLDYGKALRFIYINKKEEGLAQFAFEKGKNITKFVQELSHRKFALTSAQENKIKSYYRELTA